MSENSSHGSHEVVITLADVYIKQAENYKETTQILGDIKTSIAVLAESVKPQQGINAELFKRVLAVEKKVWAIPSGAVVISLVGILIGLLK
jgi:hypothetical protein